MRFCLEKNLLLADHNWAQRLGAFGLATSTGHASRQNMAHLPHTSASSSSLKALKPDLWWIQKLLESLELFQSEHKAGGQLHPVSAAREDLNSCLLGLHVVGQNRASCFVSRWFCKVACLEI